MKIEINAKAGIFLLAVAGCAVLASCGSDPEADKQKAANKQMPQGITLERAMIGAAKGSKPEVIRMQKVAGDWRSPTGVFTNKEEYLQLTVSNDSKFSLEVRGKSPDGKLESVNVQVRGAITWTPEGYMKGTGGSARPPIAGFASWTGKFPSDGVMTVNGTDGKTFNLTYRGL